MVPLTVVLVITLFVTQLSGNPLIDDDLKDEVGRIVNGRDANPGEASYQASLQYRSSDFHYCGATYLGKINEKEWAITAAHCARNQVANYLRVVLGALNLNDENNAVYSVKKIFQHDYDDTTKIGDVALLLIEPEEAHDAHRDTHPITAMNLPPKGANFAGKTCVVSGWGHLQAGSHPGPKRLQVVDVEMVTQSGCAHMLGSGLPWNAEAMVCAGGRDKDACQGDSGGPLVCPGVDDQSKPYLAGIVSWGVGCATEGIPGVYTNVANYRDWIDKTIQEN